MTTMIAINPIPLKILFLLVVFKVVILVESNTLLLQRHVVTNMKQRKYQIRRHRISLNTIVQQNIDHNEGIQSLFTDLTIPVVSNDRILMGQNSITTSMINNNNQHTGTSSIPNNVFPSAQISIVPIVTPVKIISPMSSLNTNTTRINSNKNDTNNMSNHAINNNNNNTIDANATTDTTTTISSIGSSSNQVESNDSKIQNHNRPMHIHIITVYIIGALVCIVLLMSTILLVKSQRKRRFNRNIYYNNNSNHHHHHQYQLSDEQSIRTISTQNMTIDDY
jgi:hypothetical protein